MKYTKPLALIWACLFLACDKQTLKSNETDYSKNTIQVVGNSAKISLVSIKNTEPGFDPCFNVYLNAQLKETIRFTGGPAGREYTDLPNGLVSFSYTCTHPCNDENESMMLQFEIDDGAKKQTAVATKAGHCFYQLKMIVLGK